MSYLFDGINHPTAQQVIASGAIGALLYGGTPADSLGKDFTAAQYADYKAHGLLCAFVFEATANDMAGGFGAGSAHAAALLADLRAKGVATTEPVGATVDEHVTAANIPLAMQYQNGFWSSVKASGWSGPVGIYGFAEVLIACHNTGHADWYWGAGQRSLLPLYTNVWQDNTGVINVGGSADDKDWILIPLPQGGTMTDLTSPAAPETPDGKPALAGITYAGELDAITEALLLGAGGGPTWPAGPGLLQRVADLATGQAAILAAIQGTDVDVKAGVAQLATAVAAVPAGQAPTDAQIQAIEASLAAALKVDVANITLTVGTKS